MQNKPLSELLRPSDLDGVVGQEKLIAEGSPLRLSFEGGFAHNMIFWGPPGTGKTTLANIASNYYKSDFISISAVFSGVKDIKAATEKAIINQNNDIKTVLFVDEIHRFNKSQQDSLLPYTESGLITLIGATTENPGFEINNALLSRCRVYKLESITINDLIILYNKSIKDILDYVVDFDAVEKMAQFADGDARKFISFFDELSGVSKYKFSQEVKRLTQQGKKIEDIDQNDIKIQINLSDVTRVLDGGIKRFDKGNDIFHEEISALHKSVRGSDPDASLYWLVSMLKGGCDPLYLARRIVRMSWEDIGLADINAQTIANNAATTYERLGSPEGELALACAVVYLAVAPKSNSVYVAYNESKSFVDKDITREVPNHLKNPYTPFHADIGVGFGYKYPHNEPNSYAPNVNYLPKGLENKSWYNPTSNGFEQQIKKRLDWLMGLDKGTNNS